MIHKMPKDLDQKIKSQILSKLNPSGLIVLLKLSLVQLVASFLVLAICPQFYLGFFPHSFLGHILMNWGEVYCNLSCGAIFLGTGTIFSFIVLSHDELRVLRKYQWIHFPTLGLISLLGFVLFGVEVQLLMFTIWLLGALGASMGILSSYFYFKMRHIKA